MASRFWHAFWRDMRPGTQNFNTVSWVVGFALAGKWIYDSERENPHIFSEAPTITGTPQARELDVTDMEKWNAAITNKSEQLKWKKPETKWGQT
mmetsp:Transcript_49383/g.131006  ORF Transcript_49383/g.131006 Transcript_49383/m.131006 type:complete len:94 (-) Transcript_49383:120-401(-)